MKKRSDLFEIFYQKIRVFFFGKNCRKKIVLYCCLLGVLLVFYSVMPVVYAGHTESSENSSRGSYDYTFGSTGLDGYGIPPRQQDKNWCVFACVTFFRYRMQCNLATEYCNMTRPSSVPFTLDCCFMPAPDPLYGPDYEEKVLLAWTMGCLGGVFYELFIPYITRVDTQIVELGDLQTNLKLGRYIGNIFPCYGVMISNSGNAHCIIICGVTKWDDIYRIYYWDPATASYKTLTNAGGDEWLNAVYYYKRYLNVG